MPGVEPHPVEVCPVRLNACQFLNPGSSRIGTTLVPSRPGRASNAALSQQVRGRDVPGSPNPARFLAAGTGSAAISAMQAGRTGPCRAALKHQACRCVSRSDGRNRHEGLEVRGGARGHGACLHTGANHRRSGVRQRDRGDRRWRGGGELRVVRRALHRARLQGRRQSYGRILWALLNGSWHQYPEVVNRNGYAGSPVTVNYSIPGGTQVAYQACLGTSGTGQECTDFHYDTA